MFTRKTTFLWLMLTSLIVCGFFVAQHAFSSEGVVVTAIVWPTNATPVVLATSPGVSPVVLRAGALQNFSLRIQDVDSPEVDYTVSVPDGALIPQNGTISDSTALAAGQWYVNFTYFAPATKPASQPTITVTISDRVNPPVVKNISLYIF